jgi:hypothetical protein
MSQHDLWLGWLEGIWYSSEKLWWSTFPATLRQLYIRVSYLHRALIFIEEVCNLSPRLSSLGKVVILHGEIMEHSSPPASSLWEIHTKNLPNHTNGKILQRHFLKVNLPYWRNQWTTQSPALPTCQKLASMEVLIDQNIKIRMMSGAVLSYISRKIQVDWSLI